MDGDIDMMIVTDLDGTLLGDDGAILRFKNWLDSMAGQVVLVYASSRFLESIDASEAKHDLPAPAGAIGGLGTQARIGGMSDPLPEWPAPYSLRRWSADIVSETLESVKGATRQAERFQSRYKVSYDFPDADDQDIFAIRKRLADRGVAANVIHSGGKFLDVVPSGIDKGAAARFLQRRFGVPTDRVVACGDSGNDLALFSCGFRGVIVGNASEELNGVDSPSVYRARASHADGILEGIDAWSRR